MELTGTIEEIKDIQIIKPKNEEASEFRKRELIVMMKKELDNRPPIIDYITIEFVQDNVDNLDNYNKGDEVKVSCNVRGRKWINPEGNTKYFNSIQGWRIEKLGSSNLGGESNFNYPDSKQGSSSKNNLDDLPF